MRKLTLSLLVVVLIAVLGLGWTLDSIFERYSSQPVDDSLLPYKETGIALARLLDLDDSPQETLKSIHLENDLLLSLKSVDEFLLPAELKSEFSTGKPLALESANGITLNFYLARSQLVLTLASPGISKEEDRNLLSLIFTILFYSGILILILVWLYPLVRRLIKLRETAKAFGQGDLSQRVTPGSVSYIDDIEAEFNHMAQRIQLLVNDNKLLSRAVSHDLRTPLARLRFGIDTLSEETDPTRREKYQKRISQDLIEMESLVETLLNYSRMDESMIRLEKSPIDLGMVISHCIQKINKNNKQISIEDLAKSSKISGDKRYLSMLINNLLQNSTRYAKSKVHVSLILRDKNIVLTIEDDGEGIPEDERKKVVKPFIRGSNANSSQGYGMGLAIVQRITDWHAGHLEISQSKSLGGAKLQMIFVATD